MQSINQARRSLVNNLYTYAVNTCAVNICVNPDSTHQSPDTFSEFMWSQIHLCASGCLDVLGNKASMSTITAYYQQ